MKEFQWKPFRSLSRFGLFFLLVGICVLRAHPAEPLVKEIEELKNIRNRVVSSREKLCWLPLMFRGTKKSLKLSVDSLDRLISEKEKLLELARSLPLRLANKTFSWDQFGIYWSFRPSGRFEGAQKVYFQTQADFSFSYFIDTTRPKNPSREAPKKFFPTFNITAVDEVPPGLHKSIGPFNFIFGEGEQIDTPLGSRVAFHSNELSLGLGDWFAGPGGKSKIRLRLLFDPESLQDVEVQVYQSGIIDPIEVHRFILK